MEINKAILVISIIVFHQLDLYGQFRGKVQLPDLKDSLSVVEYIRSTSTCEKIGFVLKNLRSFCNEEGYSGHILIDISKETKEKIVIPFATGHVILSEKERQQTLADQMLHLRKLKNCYK